MKYGEQFEKESAPQWSLHNIDYNSLKHHIKVHTTRDQASAIAIPGRQDASLGRFEDELYAELGRQHDRVDLFVSSKTDEIARRLQHLSNQIHRLLVCNAASAKNHTSLKRQRRFARYEQSLLQCGDDIQSLQRFVGAQSVAFRKICKKYRKWTGSSTLGSRFRDNVLAHPKSFTRRDFSDLQAEYDDLKTTLHSAFPTSPSGVGFPSPDSVTTSVRANEQISPSETVVATESQHLGYWNEYEHGSEADEAERRGDTAYAIYVNPNEEMSFPGVAALAALFSKFMWKLNRWMANGHQVEAVDERGPLLSGHTNHYGTRNASYFASFPGGGMSDTEAEDDDGRAATFERRTSHGYASSEEFPVGYKTYYAALPSVEDQYLARYRGRVLVWGTWLCFAVSFLLMGIAAVLIKTGRHKMRLEVDAGVTLGIMASLGAACAALGLTFSRQDTPLWTTKLAVWVGFMAVCILNGILLVLVVGNPPL